MDFTPHSIADEKEALAAIGAESIEELLAAQIPEQVLFRGDFKVPLGLSEQAVIHETERLAAANTVFPPGKNFAGAGIYNHYVPAVVGDITSRSEFVTAYTPYQPEVSQGVLQSIFEFQTMISEITALPVANASLYDGATATVEAAHVAVAHTKRKKVIVAGTIHPEYLETLRTYLGPQGVEVAVAAAEGTVTTAAIEAQGIDDAAALIVQHPNFYGCLEEVEELASLAKSSGAVMVGVVDPISLGLLAPPGDWGADIAVGEGQSLGIPPSFGDPGFGFFACREEFIRLVPGRVCGRTKDASGRTGYVLTLQTREQHIRRERATSNICTNHQLCALAATVYMSVVGPDGLRQAAEESFRRSHYFLSRLESLTGWRRVYDRPFFKELAIQLTEPSSGEPTASMAHKLLLERGILAGVPLETFSQASRHPNAPNNPSSTSYPDALLLAFNEQQSREDIDELVEHLRWAEEKLTSDEGHPTDGGTR